MTSMGFERDVLILLFSKIAEPKICGQEESLWRGHSHISFLMKTVEKMSILKVKIRGEDHTFGSFHTTKMQNSIEFVCCKNVKELSPQVYP